MGRSAFFLALVAAAAVMAGALDAAAYCRSTTCSGNCARDADGCKIEGKYLGWASMCVSFSLQRDGSQWHDLELLREVITRSFVAWSDIECAPGQYATIAFSAYADVACHRAEYNEDGPNANIILFQDNRWDYDSVDNTLAKTTVTYDADSGEIFDADIELNHAYNELTTGDTDIVYDLESIVTHEIGHFIGLDHTLDVVATMNAGYQQGTTELRTLEYDDVDAVCAAYPPGRSAQCATAPRGGFASECYAVIEAQEDDGCSVAPARAASGARRSHLVWLGACLFALGWRRRARARVHSTAERTRTA